MSSKYAYSSDSIYVFNCRSCNTFIHDIGVGSIFNEISHMGSICMRDANRLYFFACPLNKKRRDRKMRIVYSVVFTNFAIPFLVISSVVRSLLNPVILEDLFTHCTGTTPSFKNLMTQLREDNPND